MDVFSHALLPYFAGTIAKMSRRNLAALILGGVAPDLDFLILWVNYVHPTSLLLVHRGITHTFIFGFFTALAVLFAASWLLRIERIRQMAKFDLSVTAGAVLLAYAGVVTHLFLDYLTTRGAPVFYPLSPDRWSADLFFHTEMIIAAISFVIMWTMIRNRSRFSEKKMLTCFLVLFLAVGAIRIEGKAASEEIAGDGEIKTIPSSNLFYWSVLAEDQQGYLVSGYDAFTGKKLHAVAFPRLRILSDGGGLNSALDAAANLSQVRIFKWRAYAVAINASFESGVWHIEYYDPVVKAEMISASSLIRPMEKSYGSLNVDVCGKEAVVRR